MRSCIARGGHRPVSMSAQTVLVTGTARKQGIGRAILRSFVKAGYKGVGIDIKKSDPIGDDSPLSQCLFLEADLADEDQLEKACQEACTWLGGKLDVLVNNAGIASPCLPEDGPGRKAQWHKFIATNLSAAFLMTEAAKPYFQSTGTNIIHISSVRAKQSEPLSEGYASAKAGLLGLTHSQAVSLAGQCRVNAVLPGYIYTQDEDPETELTKEDHEWHLTGKVGEPGDIAELCVFLADNKRAKFITGQHFTVDGGVTAKLVYPE